MGWWGRSARWRLSHVCGTLEFVNQYVPILEPAGHRPSTDEPPRIGPMTAVATKFGWAADVIARRAPPTRSSTSHPDTNAAPSHPPSTPPSAAQFTELAETMRPSHDEFEAAFDIAIHGTGEPV